MSAVGVAEGELELALYHVDQLIERSRSVHDTRLDDALVHRAICLAELQRFDEARASLTEAAELARLYSPRSGLPNALANIACVDAREARWSEARRQLLEVLQLPQASNSHLMKACRLLLAAANAQLGRWKDVDAQLPPLVSWLATSGEADGDVLMALEGLRAAARGRPELCGQLDPLLARYRAMIPESRR